MNSELSYLFSSILIQRFQNYFSRFEKETNMAKNLKTKLLLFTLVFHLVILFFIYKGYLRKNEMLIGKYIEATDFYSQKNRFYPNKSTSNKYNNSNSHFYVNSTSY